MHQSKTYRLLALLLHQMQTDEKRISTREYLQVQTLMDKLGDDVGWEQLKYSLSPLLCKSKEEQKYFYKVFDQCVKQVNQSPIELETKEEDIVVEEPTINPNQNKWLFWLYGTLFLLLFLIGSIISVLDWAHKIEHREKNHLSYLEVKSNKTSSKYIFNPSVNLILTSTSFLEGGQNGNSKYGTYSVSDSGVLSYTAKLIGGNNLERIGVVSNFKYYGLDTTLFFISIDTSTILYPTPPIGLFYGLDTSYFIPIVENLTTNIPIKTKAQLPFPHAAPLPQAETASAWVTWWNEWGLLIQILSTLLFFTIAFLIVRWLSRRRDLIAEQGQTDKPPYVWNIDIEGDENIEYNESYYLALNQLRQRTEDEFYKLNLEKTIKATIDNGGIIKLRYEQQTKPTEYLLLIDRKSPKNHRAQLFDLMYRSFKTNEVIIDRYYFDSDIRVCYDEEHRYGIPLKDILQTHSRSRLIILGNAYQLLSPASGKLAKWTNLFDNWKEKAVLSPTPTQKWGRRERQLATQFFMFPSTMEGLRMSLDAFGNAEKTDIQRIKKLDIPHLAPINFEGDLIATIKKHYKEEVGIWIAACAIYPTLHWDLTMHLGKELSTPEKPLLTIENILSLSRLPWFVEGSIPNPAREELIGWLEENRLDLLLELRKSINDLLEESKPPEDSVAFDEYQMNLVTNELQYTTDKARRKELEAEFRKLLEKGVEHDFTIIKYLDRQPSILDIKLPKSIRKHFHPHGFRAFGWKPATWLAPLAAVLSLLVWLYNPNVPQCTGESVEYKNQALCIDSPEDQINYWTHLTRDYILADELNPISPFEQIARADSLRQVMLQYAKTNNADTLPYLQNTAVAYYNRGVGLWNSYLEDVEEGGEMRSRACAYFEKAYSLDSTNSVIRRQLAICNGDPDIEYQIADLITGEVKDFTNREYITNFTITHPTQSGNITNLKNGFYELRLQDYNASSITLIFEAEGYDRKVLDFEIGNGETTLPTVRMIPQSTSINPVTATGVVRASESNTPLPNASVSVDGQTTTTDAQGRYRLRFTPAADDGGKSSFVVTAQGYDDGGRWVTWQGNTEVSADFSLEKIEPSVNTPAMVFVQGGTFKMGSNDGEDDEKPPHDVTLSNYYIGKYEVTNAQYAAFLNAKGNQEEGGAEWVNLSGSRNKIKQNGTQFTVESGYENYPIIYVSWYGARAYCQWLSETTGQNYRLPTEAEWEYAARGGAKGISDNFTYSGSNTIDEVAWYFSNAGSRTHQVGTKKSNQLGIFDMSGNVWEWCSDWYGENYYNSSPKNNPKGPASGDYRVLRGGSWSGDADYCRSAYRDISDPDARGYDGGFRIARS